MTTRRFMLLTLLVGVLAFLAAGCGGDDDNEAAGTEGATTEAGGEAVSGNISVLAVWTGAEGESFQAVLDGFARCQTLNAQIKNVNERRVSHELSPVWDR